VETWVERERVGASLATERMTYPPSLDGGAFLAAYAESEARGKEARGRRKEDGGSRKEERKKEKGKRKRINMEKGGKKLYINTSI
jgi:hypothetical protein